MITEYVSGNRMKILDISIKNSVRNTANNTHNKHTDKYYRE